MKSSIFVVVMLAVAAPAQAQLGGLLRKAQQAQEQKQRFDDLTFSEEEERQIGEAVSERIRERFGVVQDPAVHKYVTLVGTLLARQSEGADKAWKFIVLDTDGVNAFASPGGFVHITRGALALMDNEAQLAGVLGHEIAHVVERHTIDAIRKNKMVQIGTSETLSGRAPFLDRVANRAYEMVLENNFDRGDELDADEEGVELAGKAGYAPAALSDFLKILSDRNKGQQEKNGLFASHPEIEERIEKVRRQAGSKTAPTVAARYKSTIAYKPTALTEVAVVEEGAAGLAGSGEQKDAEKKEEPKRGLGLGLLKQTVAPEKQTAQVSASGGARGVGPDRLAKGGSNPKLVEVKVSQAELDAFKSGIA